MFILSGKIKTFFNKLFSLLGLNKSIPDKNIIYGYWTKIGSNVIVGDNIEFGGWTEIGNNVTIGSNVKFGSWTKIGYDVVIGSDVTFGSHTHVQSGAIIKQGSVFEDGDLVLRDGSIVKNRCSGFTISSDGYSTYITLSHNRVFVLTGKFYDGDTLRYLIHKYFMGDDHLNKALLKKQTK